MSRESIVSSLLPLQSASLLSEVDLHIEVQMKAIWIICSPYIICWSNEKDAVNSNVHEIRLVLRGQLQGGKIFIGLRFPDRKYLE